MGRREIAIVAGVAGLILLLVIPLMMRQKVLGNQRAFREDLRLLQRLQEAYHLNASRRAYATMDELFAMERRPEGLRNADINQFKNGVRNGYVFTLEVENSGPEATFSLAAKPAVYRRTGLVSYYLDESGVVRAGDAGGAFGTAALPALGATDE